MTEPSGPGSPAEPDGLSGLEDLLRACAPQVLGTLVRRHGQFSECEDAVQEALLAAFRQWPGEGVPGNPRAWLVAVASRRLTDAFRSESARQRREQAVSLEVAPPVRGSDDTLTLFFLCCHPALSPTTQAAALLSRTRPTSGGTAGIASAIADSPGYASRARRRACPS